MSHITLISIDLAKSVFQICGLNQANKKQFNKQVKRNQLIHEVQQHLNAVIAMEACATSHYWARTFSEMGFDVRLIPAQHVKAFVRGNKNDVNDALAIAEAALRPDLKSVPIKTLEQQDIQTLLRIRTRFKDMRKVNANQLRSLLAEYGLTMTVGIHNIPKELPLILEDAENGLTLIARQSLNQLLNEHKRLTQKISQLENQLTQIAYQHPSATALMCLRGIGTISALALYASIGNGSQFKNARQLSAWLGLVPQHHGTGGKVTLTGMSKRGNTQLRTLMIHGARTVHNWANRRDDQLSEWVKSIAQRRGR